MYIDTIPNRNSPPAILLRESYREDGKIKKRTCANISKWPKGRIESIKKLLKGEFDCGIPVDKPPVSGPIFAVLFALKSIADRLQITSALGRHKLAKVALLLICARIAAKGSRRHALKWAEDHAITEILGIDSLKLTDLYSALDWLAENQERIEKNLFKRRCQNADLPDLFLYDVTSSYLEGDKNQLAYWGYNRDGKKGKKQIVIGLLTDNDGEPVAVRVYDGNTGDTSTVPEQILLLSKKFGVKRVTFVGDKGMVRGPQVEQLQKAGYNYCPVS
ncbi:MAG: transposase [Planctomycetes bacterium]|nr:transposase [Planctomycetota bacterium]